MKTAEEYLNDIRIEIKRLGLNPISMEEAKKMKYYKPYVETIEQIQKDAYNQALVDAAENADAYLDYNDIPRVGKQSILKLKKL